MTAAATITRHHKALLEVLQPSRVVRQDERLLAVLDAAMAQLAVESVALRALAECVEVDTREHLDAHGRARLALFRMATSPSDAATLEDALEELRSAFVERPRSLAGTLVEHLDAPTLARLAEEMESLR
jgi:hypothetical protein